MQLEIGCLCFSGKGVAKMKMRIKKHDEPKSEKQVCGRLATCSFFSELGQSDKFRARIYQNNYCEGPQREKCARHRFYTENNAEPPINLAPTGIYLTNNKQEPG